MGQSRARIGYAAAVYSGARVVGIDHRCRTAGAAAGHCRLVQVARRRARRAKNCSQRYCCAVEDPRLCQRRRSHARGPGIVRTIMSLAHSLNFKVVAEGVETEEQANLLRLLKCDQAQGYLYSPPVSAENFFSLLASN